MREQHRVDLAVPVDGDGPMREGAGENGTGAVLELGSRDGGCYLPPAVPDHARAPRNALGRLSGPGRGLAGVRHRRAPKLEISLAILGETGGLAIMAYRPTSAFFYLR